MDIDFGNLTGMVGTVSGAVDNAFSVFDRLRNLAEDDKLPLDFAVDFVGLSTQLGKAKVDMARLETEIMKLQRAYEALEKIEQRKRNYVLAETPKGARVYRLKDDANTGEPLHEVCPGCFEKDEFSILQPRGSFLQCDRCSTNYQVAEA